MVYIFLMLTAIFSFHSVVIPSDNSNNHLLVAKNAISNTLTSSAFWIGATTAATATAAFLCNRPASTTCIQEPEESVQRPTAQDYADAVKALNDLREFHNNKEAEFKQISNAYVLTIDSWKEKTEIATRERDERQREVEKLTAQLNSAQQEVTRRMSPSRLDSARAELAETQKQLAARPTFEQLQAAQVEAQRAASLEEELRSLKASITTTTSASAEAAKAHQNDVHHTDQDDEE